MSGAGIHRAGLVTALLMSSTHCVNSGPHHTAQVPHSCPDSGLSAHADTNPDVGSQSDHAVPARADEAFDRKMAVRGFEALTRQDAEATADRMAVQAVTALAPCDDWTPGSHPPDPRLEQLRQQLVDEIRRARNERAPAQRRELELEAEGSRGDSPQ